MDRKTISHYGWIVVMTLVIAVMIALATPLGNYMQEVAQNITDAFITVGEKATDQENINKYEDMWQDKIDDMTAGQKYTQVHNDIIPVGGVYLVGITSNSLTETSGATTEYSKGDKFPLPQKGDIYVYREYIYKYGYENDGTKWVEATCGTSWGIAVLDNTQTDYEEPITEINYEKLTCHANLFKNNQDILSGIGIANHVTHMTSMYEGCSFLIEVPNIPIDATVFDRTFYNCTSLPKAPKLHDGIISIDDMFNGCTSMSIPPQLPATLQSMNSAFNNCEVLMYVPEIPETVTHMNYAFAGCLAITSANTIPASVKEAKGAFENCTNLRGTIAINATLTSYDRMFGNCAINAEHEIKIAGTASDTIKKNVGRTGYNSGQYIKYISSTGELKSAK